MAASNSSKIASTAKTSFSPMQSRLLSKAAPATMDRAAFSRSAVSSTTTGGFPGPGHDGPLGTPQCRSPHRRTAGDAQEPDPAVIEDRLGGFQGRRADDCQKRV